MIQRDQADGHIFHQRFRKYFNAGKRCAGQTIGLCQEKRDDGEEPINKRINAIIR